MTSFKKKTESLDCQCKDPGDFLLDPGGRMAGMCGVKSLFNWKVCGT